MNPISAEIPGHRRYLLRDVLIIAGLLVLVGVAYSVTYVSDTNPGSSVSDPSGPLSMKTDDANRIVSTGNQLMDAGRFDEAISHYSQALLLDSTLVDVRVDRGSCYFAVERYQDAVVDFSAAITIDPGHATAHFNLGITYAAMGYDSLMIDSWERCIQLEPEGELANRIRRFLRDYESERTGGD